MKHVLLLILLLALVSCASSPLKLEGVNRDINPAMVTPDHPHSQTRVVWGGMIVKTVPLQHTTQIEVLAFPLQQNGEPDRQAASLGRFLIEHQGFLEPADFAPGRWLSAVGRIGRIQTGKVGKASYHFPVLQPEQLQLWPTNAGSNVQTRFHFGIGIQF